MFVGFINFSEEAPAPAPAPAGLYPPPYIADTVLKRALKSYTVNHLVKRAVIEKRQEGFKTSFMEKVYALQGSPECFQFS